jgi:O-succinylbenzoic acid--CoA ligase
MVVTGGVNVPAVAVAHRLREHPAVEEAEVIGVPDEEWGNRVVAVVAPVVEVRGRPRPSLETTTLDDLRDWVTEAHPRSWAPRQLGVVDEIPLLANGKPDRQALRALVAASGTGER